MLRYPSLVSQAGLFKTGTPHYFNVYTGDPAEGPNGETFRTFLAAATAESWADGDLVGLYAQKADGSQKVWIASWDAANTYLLRVSEELTTGTWADGDQATITAVTPSSMLTQLFSTPPQVQAVEVTGATYSVLANDSGKTLCCTNAVSCDVTLPQSLPVGFQVQIIQEGAGTVTVYVEGADTINGASSPFAFSARWTSAFVYQRTEGAWGIV